MIIFDEKRYAEALLKNGFATKNKNVYELNILAKYLFYKGFKEDIVKQRLIKFCEKHLEHFNIDEWYKVINTTVSYAKNGNLKTDKEVNITEKELEIIKDLDTLREQKLTFVMLVLYKFYNYNKFTVSLEDLFTLSELTTINSKTRLQLLHKLTSKGLIDINMKGRRWVKFAEKKSDPMITIKTFENFIWEYLFYIGEGKYKRCEECNLNLVKMNIHNHSYCEYCRIEIKKIRDRLYQKERYNSRKASKHSKP